MRIATANQYDVSVEQLLRRQTDVATQQEKIASGLRVNRPSDDPAAAGAAERDRVRINRIAVDQRALEQQRAAISTAESALGEASELARGIREQVLTAGNAGYSARDRTTLANQMRAFRDQLFALANRADSQGVPLFGGLGGSGSPFADLPAGVQYQANGGQRSPSNTALPGTMDGAAIFMDVPDGNGSFKVTLGALNGGTAWTSAGDVLNASALTGHDYSIQFSVAAGVTTYSIVDTTSATTLAVAQPYVDGAPIQFDGLSVNVNGTPANGDVVTLAPSVQSNTFKVIDDAINAIDNSPGGNKLTHAITLALTEIDTAMGRLHAARSQAGEWLNRADAITDLQDKRSLALEEDRSRAQDLDMARGITDFNRAQTGYQAALQTYAQVQRLSLFNYIN